MTAASRMSRANSLGDRRSAEKASSGTSMVTVVNVFLHFPGNLVRSSHHPMDQRQASLNIIPASDTVELPRVRVQRPGLEVTIGEGLRPSPIADDQRGLASDRQPVRDRQAADERICQPVNQGGPLAGITMVREDETPLSANTEDFPERVTNSVIADGIFELENGHGEGPSSRRLVEGEDVDGEILALAVGQHRARKALRRGSPPHCRARFHHGGCERTGPVAELSFDRGRLEELAGLRVLEITKEVGSPGLGESLLYHYNPSPFFLPSTPSTHRFSSVPGGYRAESDCASFQNRASLPMPSSTRNRFRASDRPRANRSMDWWIRSSTVSAVVYSGESASRAETSARASRCIAGCELSPSSSFTPKAR